MGSCIQGKADKLIKDHQHFSLGSFTYRAGSKWGPQDRNEVKITDFVKDSSKNRKFSLLVFSIFAAGRRQFILDWKFGLNIGF